MCIDGIISLVLLLKNSINGEKLDVQITSQRVCKINLNIQVKEILNYSLSCMLSCLDHALVL